MFIVCSSGNRVCLHQSWFVDQLGGTNIRCAIRVESMYIRAFVLVKIFEFIMKLR